MNKIKQYLIACMALLTLTACPDDDDTKEVVQKPSQTYRQEVTMPSNASEQMVTLSSLSSSIVTVMNSTSWLIVEQQFYTSGSPQIKLRTTDNTDKNERKCEVTVTATTGDKVILTVTQQGATESTEGTAIDDIHGSQSDKPAYSRQK